MLSGGAPAFSRGEADNRLRLGEGEEEDLGSNASCLQGVVPLRLHEQESEGEDGEGRPLAYGGEAAEACPEGMVQGGYATEQDHPQR